ncbi:tRNA (adenosine(37)-N6)-dimethylallyltransferase MiaA [Labrys sp. KNU-23]|uniref:tRNA (adenosine(37)-N6)-dimethylallyltransferase MiaA n=1 Tax=Labrys sp. KNU-23 TaxID=2789216 RepID=UPI0011EF97ED|nr:tRNA (adenosine(37)-N6)-dimethylallyltransferase MiaA [Labrys sp. KNU-23]QEN87153.1 tRNA (adenosine(37)-N6)-dimethylallyltransferase MiaA [Labrys sp. KNU-23]
MTAIQYDAVLLAGPTASGKSALALALAERFGGSIINADSMQVYRDLAVLSARPDAGETARAPHLLYGHVDGAINYSVGRWRADAAAALDDVRRQQRLPIVIGGTGLYFKALERGLAEMPAVPDSVRDTVRAKAEGLETQALHAWLNEKDPAMANRLRPSDRQRLIRALEILEATGRSLSEWQGEPHSPPLLDADKCLRLFLSPERAELYARIDRRFDLMVGQGAIEEVRALSQRGLDPALPVMRAHGVPGLCRYLAGEIRLDEAIAGAKADTRHYAKRQFTWFRHQMPGWRFVEPAQALAIASAALMNEI